MKIKRADVSTISAALTLIAAMTLAAAQALAGGNVEKTDSKTASADTTTMMLRGGEEGTLFESLRVEGEDRVRIRFDRPALDLSPDANAAPGLDWEGVQDIINRTGVDLVKPLLDRSAGERPTCYSRPWLDNFVTGGVARFRPTIEGVDRWRLLVADSKGDTVAGFEGKGKPPKEIAWDGRTPDGNFAAPGLVYSYVLEAYDRAGNKRNFVGEGFELPSYRIEGASGAMLFSGAELDHASTAYGGGARSSAILLEVASWLNQEQEIARPVVIEITAREFSQAKYLADEISRQLKPLLLGDPVRVRTVTNVQPDAPERGTVAITVTS
jgi:hypothetical protein